MAVFLGILCGGQSRRMGRDKALLEYHPGIRQREFCYRLGSSLGLATFFSVSQQQQWNLPCVPDHWPGCGPMGGIASLLQSRPDSAWLVIACDMPDLSRGLLSRLLLERRPGGKATIYRSDSGLEPLCALYEPSILPDLVRAIDTGRYGLRRLLANLRGIHSIATWRPMLNINTPEELRLYQS